MANMTNAELAQIVRELQAQVDRLTGKTPVTDVDVPPEERADYIAHGSEEHAAFLGLRKLDKDEIKAEQEKEHGLLAEGPDGEFYTLIDRTIFGVAVRHEFLEAFLEQRVGQLREPEVHPQAPPMWRPTEAPVRGIVS